jgi:hypothetical protein
VIPSQGRSQTEPWLFPRTRIDVGAGLSLGTGDADGDRDWEGAGEQLRLCELISVGLVDCDGVIVRTLRTVGGDTVSDPDRGENSVGQINLDVTRVIGPLLWPRGRVRVAAGSVA